MLEKTLESPMDSINLNIGRTDAEVKTPILWPPDAKNCLIGKDQFMEGLMLGKIEGRRKRG